MLKLVKIGYYGIIVPDHYIGTLSGILIASTQEDGKEVEFSIGVAPNLEYQAHLEKARKEISNESEQYKNWWLSANAEAINLRKRVKELEEKNES
jgi:hypothetical protein